jgi:hypothetical protein
MYYLAVALKVTIIVTVIQITTNISTNRRKKIETLEHTFYTSVPSVDNDVRKHYLEEVKEIVNRVF